QGSWNDPDRLAREFTGEQTWRLWNSLYWHYAGTRYEKYNEDDVRDALSMFIQKTIDRLYEWALAQYAVSDQTDDKPPRKPQTSRALVANVLGALRPRIKLPPATRMPTLFGAGRAP